nr:potassium channel family protein [Halomonas sp. UBA3074]
MRFVTKIWDSIIHFDKFLYNTFISSSKRVVLSAIALYVVLLFVFAKVYLSNIDKGIDGFFDALYFSFVTMTTLGYGDIAPDTNLSKGAVFFQVSAGLFLFGIVISYIVKDHEEEIFKKERLEKKNKDDMIFSKYVKKMLAITKSFDRSINHLMECGIENEDFFSTVKFSALKNMCLQSGKMQDGLIVSRIDNYIFRREIFLKEIEFMVLNLNAEAVSEFSEDIFEHLSLSQEREFILFFSYFDKMVAGKKHKVKDYALASCASHESRPAIQNEGNVLNPFVELYDDVLSQKKMILKLNKMYKHS